MENCPLCGASFDNISKWGIRKFCSRKCANTRTHTPETKMQISKSVSEAFRKTDSNVLELRYKKVASSLAKPKLYCNCGKHISHTNKHKMCLGCYHSSDIAKENSAHYSKNYSKKYVTDSCGTKHFLMSSLEILYYEYLTKNNILWEKPKFITYTDDIGKLHKYTPDFYLVESCEYVEIKGYWWPNDKVKMAHVITQNSDLKFKILMRKDLINLMRDES